MSIYTVGIDPGMSGAMVLIKDSKVRTIFDITTKKSSVYKGNEIDAGAFWAQFNHIYVEAENLNVVIEHVPMIQGKGTAPSKQNRFVGVMIGVLATYEIDPVFVEATQWKNHYGFKRISNPPKTTESKKRVAARLRKDEFRELAKIKFPEAAQYLERVSDVDRAEAMLLALYWQEIQSGDNNEKS